MTPKEEGYYMPAEWAKHKGTWLSYPHNGYGADFLPPVPD